MIDLLSLALALAFFVVAVSPEPANISHAVVLVSPW